MAENERCPSEAQHPARQPCPPEQHESIRRGIVIQLTGTEGEWDSLDDNELIFTLDNNSQKSLSSTSALPKPRPCSMDIQTEDEWSPHTSMFHVPLSPSSPGSLGYCSSSSGLGFLSPTHRPLASLVKSLSTELELKETSSLKPKPLLSLVKSISTELSRSEPEVSQSKSDSKLNLHLWTQLTQHKNRNGDSHTAPPSPVDLFPSEPKAGFFKVELEDTRRKLTEAMHEPFSVFSKIMREDSVGSPKHHKSTGSMDSLCSKGLGRPSGDHSIAYEYPVKSSKRAECDGLPMCNWTVRHRNRCPQRCHHSKPEDAEAMPGTCIHGDVMQDEETTNKNAPAAEHPCPKVPKMALGCVAALTYCYFIFPWSLYWSGMFEGLAMGFMLTLLLIRLGLTRSQPFPGNTYRLNENLYDGVQNVSGTQDESSLCSVQLTGVSNSGSTENISSVPVFPADLMGKVRENILLDCTSYMTSLTSSAHAFPPTSSCLSSTQSSPTEKEQKVCYHEDEMQTVWINALIGRIFWDFLREKYWADQVAHKIQRKLSKIRLPYFMDELTLTELTMGSCMPQITSTSLPHINTRGLWLQLEIEYTGALQMTLETKINLSKLGKDGDTEAVREVEACSVRTRSKLSVLADSDEESSSAGSSDEEEAPSSEPQGTLGEKGTVPGAESSTTGGSTGRRILRFVDKIAKSKYFQKATENEYIKKKIEEMSNMPLLLTVEVRELSGTLVVNIPPPPTDRIWYSFCMPPKLDLRVRPKLGEREVTFWHVTEWIEKRLQDEFQKVFVLPNMDDIYLPLMDSGMENQSASQQNPTPRCSSVDSPETCTLNHTL
ncbi:hypothetical protein NFI96_004312 [Prochilodus magdalenae]|nr:hypothetical protein NFI96_004312 [Prochilodus magdalenae]